jgi:hypothetical protein
MKLMKLSTLVLLCAVAFGATACSSDRANVAKVEQEIKKEDGSTVVISVSSNGTRAEAREFPTGDVARVSRITTPNGQRRAIAEFRDSSSIEIKDGNEVDRVIEASADVVKSAAIKARDAAKTAGSEVADKTEDATDKAAEVGKDVGKEAKSVSEAVGDAASDTAEAAKKGAKKTGKGMKKVGEKIKDSIKP